MAKAPSDPSGASTRRGLLIGAGLVGAAGVVAACGGDDGGDASGGGQTNAPATGGGQALTGTADIPVGGGKVFESEKVVVVQPTQGEFKAYTATCTHRGCSVGSVSGGTINCPCHGSKFNVSDGSVANPPADEPLAERQITVKNDQIMLA